MRRFLLVLAVLVAGALGWTAWWAMQRPPSTAPQDDQASDFLVQPSGQGRFIKFNEASLPLRAFRWLPPLPGGALAAQVLGQNDRQRVALFHDGTQDLMLVRKPQGVPDGFWRFAALRQAALAPGGTLLLLYGAGDPESAEQPLALALDLASQQVRWTCRGAFAHLALGPGQAPSVYLYGAAGPVLRLPLVPAGAAQHPAPESIELPGTVPDVEDLLPIGAGGLLVSHRDGLSVYKAGAWSLLPPPQDDGPACLDWKSSLVRSGKDVWWQPSPGRLVKVRPDGSLGAVTRWRLEAADPLAPDARLLRILGADPDGRLWFDLASPSVLPAPAPAPAPAAQPAPDQAQAAAPDAPVDWAAYAAAGLDRVYRWNPARGGLERVALKQALAALDPPAAMPLPQPGPDLVPASGTLLAQSGRSAWWLPLAALPFVPVKNTLVQAM